MEFFLLAHVVSHEALTVCGDNEVLLDCHSISFITVADVSGSIPMSGIGI
jgi:hypothetical protein